MVRFMAALAALCIPVWSAAQTVSTLVPPEIPVGDGIVVAPSGDIIVPSGFGRPTVMRITPDGEVSQLTTGLSRAVGVAVDSDGFFYVNNYGNGRISRIAPDGETAEWASGLNGPAGIVFGADGAAYISEFGANFSGNGQSVVRIGPDGTREDFLIGNGLRNPIGIAFGGDGALYISNWDRGEIYRSRDGATPELFVRLEGANINQIAYAGGYLYVPSPNLRKIFRVADDGTVEHIAGSGAAGYADGPALEASFTRPNGIAASPDGSVLYVVDAADGAAGAIRSIELAAPSTAVEDSSWGEIKSN